MSWQLGRSYTRREIHNAVGGSVQSYLPTNKDAGVVAACLRPDLNPDAPDVVLPGRGAEIERTADWLCDHPQHEVPVFLKRDTNRWEYVGRYRCAGWSDDTTEIQKRTPGSRSDPVYRVLFLKRVN
jgi:hypothetical protein